MTRAGEGQSCALGRFVRGESECKATVTCATSKLGAIAVPMGPLLLLEALSALGPVVEIGVADKAKTPITLGDGSGITLTIMPLNELPPAVPVPDACNIQPAIAPPPPPAPAQKTPSAPKPKRERPASSDPSASQAPATQADPERAARLSAAALKAWETRRRMAAEKAAAAQAPQEAAPAAAA